MNEIKDNTQWNQKALPLSYGKRKETMRCFLILASWLFI